MIRAIKDGFAGPDLKAEWGERQTRKAAPPVRHADSFSTGSRFHRGNGPLTVAHLGRCSMQPCPVDSVEINVKNLAATARNHLNLEFAWAAA